MSTFNEDLVKWRAHKDQQRIQARVNDIAEEIREAELARNDAFVQQDEDTADHWDLTARRLYAELQDYIPRQQPQLHPKDVEFLNKKRAFRERHGAAADEAIQQAHQYVTRPRLPHANINTVDSHGMGIRPNTPAYYKRMNDLLDLYAKEQADFRFERRNPHAQ
jgi:hypothetical protein